MIPKFLFLPLFCISLNSFSQLYGPEWAGTQGGGGSALVLSLAVDPATGDNYSTGNFYGDVDFDPSSQNTILSSGSNITFITKFNTTGELIWAIPLPSIDDQWSNDSRDIVYSDGFVYVYGQFGGTVDFDPGNETHTATAVSSQDLFILKLDSDGNFQWVTTVTNEGTFDSRMLSVDKSANGGIYISGNFEGFQEFDPDNSQYDFTATYQGDGFVCKFDLEGNFLWAITMRSHLECMVEGVLGSNAGNGHSIICGQYFWDLDFDTSSNEMFVDEDDDNSIEGFIAELDDTGNVVWYKILYSSSEISLFSLTHDESGAGGFLLTGSFKGTVDFDPGASENLHTSLGVWMDVFAMKLDLNGNHLWTYTAGGLEYDYGWDIAAHNGLVYVTGTVEGGVDFNPGTEILNAPEFGEADVFVLQLSSDDGSALDVKSIGGNSQDNSIAIATDDDGSVYATGHYRSNICFIEDFDLENAVPGDFAFDVYLAKYTLEPSIENTNEYIEQDLMLFPIPASDELNLRIPGSSESHIIGVYDTAGRTLVEKTFIGNHFLINLSDFHPGLYFVEVTSHHETFTKQFVVE